MKILTSLLIIFLSIGLFFYDSKFMNSYSRYIIYSAIIGYLMNTYYRTKLRMVFVCLSTFFIIISIFINIFSSNFIILKCLESISLFILLLYPLRHKGSPNFTRISHEKGTAEGQEI